MAARSQAAAALPAGGVTWRSDISSDVTSLSSVTPRSVAVGEEAACWDRGQVVCTARQLIAELQEMLMTPDCADDSRQPAAKPVYHPATKWQQYSGISSMSTLNVSKPRLQPQPVKRVSLASGKQDSQQQQQQQQQRQRKSRQPESAGISAAVPWFHHQHRPPPVSRLQTIPPTACLDLQACNGLCLVFANFSTFLPTLKNGQQDAADAKFDYDADEDTRHRAGQIRDTASAVGELFNSRMEFTVLIHWNKTRRETLQLLRQAASAMSEGGRDCCFAFFLGKGGPGHFAAACGGRITLTDILATLAVGQRSRLPVFIFSELTSTLTTMVDDQQEEQQRLADLSLKPDLPGDQLLLWTLDSPQVTDMIVQQLARSHQSGGKDVASTVAGVAEWLRRRGKDGETDAASRRCRFLSRLGRLVYLTSPDCI